MTMEDEKPRYLRKLIDIPWDIVKDLKILALEADKTLKQFIQDTLVIEVQKSRELSAKKEKPDRSPSI